MAFATAWYIAGHLDGTRTDFATFWRASGAMLAGADPYQTVRREFGAPLYYPLPALLVLAPFSLLPLREAQAIFVGLSVAALAWAAIRYGRGLAGALVSMSVIQGVAQGQWSMLLTAGVALPWLSALWVAKPSIGTALFVGKPRRLALIGGAGLLGASLVVDPLWPRTWLQTVADVHHLPLVAQPGGFVLLLALIRWRQPEARLLAGLACIPQAGLLYETVPLFLIPRTRTEGYWLAYSTFVAEYFQVWFYPATAQPTLEANIAVRWPVLLTFVYGPALIMVLRRPAVPPALKVVADSGAKTDSHHQYRSEDVPVAAEPRRAS